MEEAIVNQCAIIIVGSDCKSSRNCLCLFQQRIDKEMLSITKNVSRRAPTTIEIIVIAVFLVKIKVCFFWLCVFWWLGHVRPAGANCDLAHEIFTHTEWTDECPTRLCQVVVWKWLIEPKVWLHLYWARLQTFLSIVIIVSSVGISCVGGLLSLSCRYYASSNSGFVNLTTPKHVQDNSYSFKSIRSIAIWGLRLIYFRIDLRTSKSADI